MHVHPSGQESAISHLFVFWELADFLGNKKEYLLLYNQKKKYFKAAGFSCIEKCLAISQQKNTPNVPVVMTTPARTFRRAWGEVKLSVSSLNLSTTRRDTASARTWNQIHKHTCRHTDTSLCQIRQLTKRLMLSFLGTPCSCHSLRIQLQTKVRVWNGNKWN